MSRLLAVLVGGVVLLGGVLALSSLLSSRDDAEVTDTEGPGREEPDRGAEHTAPAGRGPGELPTSGTHRPDLVSRDARSLTRDQVLHALELGNVVVTYPGTSAPAELRELQEAVAGPFDAELAAAGQAVILAAEVPGAIQALAWRRRQPGSGPGDPALRAFADFWLGRGAGDGS